MSPPTTSPGDVLSAVGILLSLASLIGTFFYIRLGDLVRDTEALKTRWRLYKSEPGDSDSARVGRNECRATLDGMQNPSSVLLIVIPSLSVVVMLAASMIILSITPWTQLTRALGITVVVFLVVFCTLTSMLYSTAMKNLTTIRAAVKEYDTNK